MTCRKLVLAAAVLVYACALLATACGGGAAPNSTIQQPAAARTTTEAPTTTTITPLQPYPPLEDIEAFLTTTSVLPPPMYVWESELDLGGVIVRVSEPQADTALSDTEKLFLDDGYGVFYVTVAIRNDTDEAFSYSPIQLRLTDSEGQVFTMSTLCSEPRLESGVLQAGRIVKGAVPFEMPLDSTPAYVDYFPDFEGYGTPEWLAATWGYSPNP